MEYLQGADFSEVGRCLRQLSGWRCVVASASGPRGRFLMALGDGSWAAGGGKAASREASPQGQASTDANERPRYVRQLASSRVRRFYAPEPTSWATPTRAPAARAPEQREFRRESCPRPLRQRVLMHTPGPAKILLDGEIKDPPKDFLGPPPQRRPPPSPRDNTQAPGSLSPASTSLFVDITRRTASLMGLGGSAGSVPWAAELPAATRVSNRHGLPPNDPWVEGGALQGRPTTPALLRAAQAAVAGLWGRATSPRAQDSPPRPRSRSSGSLLAPPDRKHAFPYQPNLSLRDAYLSTKNNTLPGMQGNDTSDVKAQGSARNQTSCRSRRAAAAASVGAGEPPSALATGESPPPAGRPISRRSRSDPQRT